MKIDIYGSRSLMIKLVELASQMNIRIADSFIGTNLASQRLKEVPISQNRMKRIISEYEYVEIRTDLSKRFRRFKSLKESNILFIDFMHEGKDLIDVHNGTVVDRPVLKRYGYDTNKATLHKMDRVSNISKDIEDLLDYITNYKQIILIKMRTPKYTHDENGQKILVENFHEVNKLNSFAEMCEDLLISNLPELQVIELYKSVDNLREGYQKTSSYSKYLQREINNILNTSKVYL